MKRMGKKSTMVILITIILALIGSFPAMAQERQTFKFASMFPETHLRAQAWKAYADKVEAATNGQVIFKIGYAESLVKVMQEYEAVRMGAIDISASPSVYTSGYLPIGLYTDIPGFAETYPEAIEQFKKVLPIIDEKLGQAGLKLLWGHPCTMYNVCCNSKVGFIRKIEDLKGVKIRVAGGLASEAFKIWGSAPVTLPSSEEYMALKLGTTNCTYIGTDSYTSFKLWEVAPYVTTFKHPLYFHFIKMNMRSWNRISKENQNKILQAGAEMMDTLSRTFVADQEGLYEAMTKNGAKYHEPSNDLRKAMGAGLAPLWDTYLQRAGQAGEKISKTIRP